MSSRRVHEQPKVRLAGWRIGWFCACFALIGCAHGQGQKVAVASASTDSARIDALEAKLAERERQFRELENRLALLEAEQRQMRYAIAERAEAPSGIRDTVRLGRAKQGAEAANGEPAEPPPPVREARQESSERRPVLRLVGDKRRDSTQSAALMPIPQVSERLPVAPVPAKPAAEESPDAHYARAIDLVRQRAFEHALTTLTDFLARYPSDTRTPRVLFWRGEVLFAQHDYSRALAAFETALLRDPVGDKAPDALLKVSLCHKRLGDSDRARSAIQKLKTQFPQSNAARLAAQEDAS